MHKLSFELIYSKLWVKVQIRFGFRCQHLKAVADLRGSGALIESHSETISFHFHGNI